jgi:hypothetical protein
LIAAAAVSSSFERQKHTGELELLLFSTPLSVEEIIRGAQLSFRKTLANHWRRKRLRLGPLFAPKNHG